MTLDEAITIVKKLIEFSKANGHDQERRMQVLLNYFIGERERLRDESID